MLPHNCYVMSGLVFSHAFSSSFTAKEVTLNILDVEPGK